MKRESSPESISVFGGGKSTFKPPKFTVVLEGKQRGVFSEDDAPIAPVYSV